VRIGEVQERITSVAFVWSPLRIVGGELEVAEVLDTLKWCIGAAWAGGQPACWRSGCLGLCANLSCGQSGITQGALLWGPGDQGKSSSDCL